MRGWPAAMLGALLSTLARPRWWAMSLAAFLVRGGVLLILLPIVALPSIAGLAAAFGQALVGFPGWMNSAYPTSMMRPAANAIATAVGR